LAGLSKSAAATLPVTLVVLDWWKNGNLNGRVIFSKWPFWLVSAGLVILTFITRSAEGHDIGGSANAFSMVDRLFMISQTIFFYPFKLLVPSGYSIFYPFVKQDGMWRADYYLALPAVTLLAWWVVKNWNKHRDIIFGTGLYLAPLFLMLPVVSVGTAEMRNDRYAYLPSLGVFFLLTLLLDKLRSDTGKYAVLGALAALFAWNASNQTGVWKDGTALFGNCVDKTPEAALCQCNLGYSELLALSFEKSVEHYSNALRLDPTYVEAYNGRGQAYMNLKKIPEAVSDFTKAVEAGIVTPKLFGNRGKCYALLGRFEESLPDLSKSLELEPKSAEIWYFRAFSSEKTGKITEAVSDYSRAIELNPNYVEALVNRGLLYYKDNNFEQAIKDDTRALEVAAAGIKPMILVNRANALLQSGQPGEALRDLNDAVALDPNYKRAYQSRAAVYMKLGQEAKAREDLAR
jgi:tetratricopeptide (TPR) repeat protein